MNEEKIKACAEREEEINLFLWDELEEDRSDALELHLESCAGCRAAVAEERQLLAVLREAAPAEPSAELLAQCRTELMEEIEHAGLPGFWTRLGTVLWPRGWRWSLQGWMAAHPAFSGAALVMLGVAVGGILPRLAGPPVNEPTGNSVATVERVNPQPQPVTMMNVTDVGLSDGQLEFRGNRETPEVVRLDLNDPQARQMLMVLIQNGQQFPADTRLKSVEFLQAQAGDDESVRKSLCDVARTDRNPAVRLRALEALKGMGQDERVQQTILHALMQDENPGVRIEAINSLRELVEAEATPDRALVRVLRERMEKDPLTYVRLQSAAAVRSLEQRGVY